MCTLGLALMLVAASAGVSVVPTDSAACDTVSACIVELRKVAAPGGGITPAESNVAGRLQGLSPASIAPVIELLEDPEEDVRELAGYALGRMPGLESRHLAPLARAVEEGNGWLPPAIASIGTPEAIRFLVGQLVKEPQTHTQLTGALIGLGPAAFPDLLELYRCGTACDPSVLGAVGFVLSEVREGGTEAVEPLEAVATDPGSSLVARGSAIRALGGLGATARPAAATLLAMTHQTPVELQTVARDALLAIGGPGTRDALLFSLEAAEEKTLVLRDIAQLLDGGREAGPEITRLLDSTEPGVRVAAARALGFIQYRAAGTALVAALDDPNDWRLVLVAAESLGRLRSEEAREALQATASGHWYPTVRQAAATALKALEGRHRYASPSRGNFALEFFSYMTGGEAAEPCADEAGFPPASHGALTLDPLTQPALAEQLAYDRAIHSFDDKGPQTTHRRTLPEVGLRVEGGWLVGVDQGEWGGELVFKGDTGSASMVLERNIAGLHVLGDGSIVAVTGLAHLGFDQGALYRITCPRAGECTATWWKSLPGAARSSWVIETRELLVNTRGGSVVIGTDGSLAMASCHANRTKGTPDLGRDAEGGVHGAEEKLEFPPE